MALRALNSYLTSLFLLLTDPPYGISKEYTCERQVSRRLRKDGTDFIMPKGNFGEWDSPVAPCDWTQTVLPKVKGWFVTFCAQAQIGEYCQILQEHKFWLLEPSYGKRLTPFLSITSTSL